ncbi:TetR family transcriptional regulator [Parvibaculum sedimenti]|uniref:TetR family transcriptional regulator n=1 Tax=Parvibaculum sedimenti TaxID=2608632 RepID=A0A6N6VJL5_9HYPH|nr:TetR/AcrR family transcriptional regulator [Parvibaculum sedimenti]KAB7740407.1 TetR family transcriptional regulator [Parvibaculum sedimenti]
MTSEQSKSDISRARILDAAAKTFRQKGYAATTLIEIARAAGMQAGSLYYHFGSKDELLEEVLDIGMRRVHEAVEESQERLPADSSHRDRIRVAVEAHLATLLKHDDYTSANIRIFGQVPEEVQKHHIRQRDAYAELWRRILTKAQKSGALRRDVDLGLVRMLLMGALNWSVEWYQPGRTSIRTIADHMCLMLFNGIGIEEPARSRENETVA